MVAVAASEDEVLPLLVEGVGIAAINAPEAVVVSGEHQALADLAGGWGAAGPPGAVVGGVACVSFTVDGADGSGVRAGSLKAWWWVIRRFQWCRM